jgi:hypothetical protein
VNQKTRASNELPADDRLQSSARHALVTGDTQLRQAIEEQLEARYLLAFFGSPKGSSTERPLLVQQWTTAVQECSAQLARATQFAQMLDSDSAASTQATDILKTDAKVQTCLLAIAEMVRVACRIQTAVSVHKAWLLTEKADWLEQQCDEVKAAYSMLVSTLSGICADTNMPMPHELFDEISGTFSSAPLAADQPSSIATALLDDAGLWPGDHKVCSLCLHRLRTSGYKQLPLHLRTATWGGKLYLAPCANWRRHCASIAS